MSVAPKVLVVDDDRHIGDLLLLHLDDAGFEVTCVCCGQRGFELAEQGGFDLIVISARIPGKDGIEICRELKLQKASARIMMLTHKGDEIEKEIGAELGADDYITKPFCIREVVARAKALVQQKNFILPQKLERITIGDLTIDPETRDVALNGSKTYLTCTEFDLLYFLAKHPGRPFTRAHLLNAVWGYTSSAYEHTVNTHINRLRAKIEPNQSKPTFIQTVWGVGYKCVAAEDITAVAA